jgi:hypothetical protein
MGIVNKEREWDILCCTICLGKGMRGIRKEKKGEMGKEGNKNGNKITWGKVIRRKCTAQRDLN